jgi:hypothetical protein
VENLTSDVQDGQDEELGEELYPQITVITQIEEEEMGILSPS